MTDRAQFFLEMVLETVQANYLPTDLCWQAWAWGDERDGRTE